MHRFASVRRSRRLIARLGATVLLLVGVLASSLITGPTVQPSAAPGPTGSPAATAVITSGPSPTPVVVASPTEYLPACTGSASPDRAEASSAPIAGSVAFETIARLGGPISAIEVSGSHAFVAAGATVQVVDLDSSGGALVVASVAIPAYATDLALEGDILAVAAGEAGLVLLDLADPGRPAVTDTVPLPG